MSLFSKDEKRNTEEKSAVVHKNDVRRIPDMDKVDLKEAAKIDKKELRHTFKIATSCQELVPIRRVFPDQNIIETEEGIYTRQYPIPDVNFIQATDDEQRTMYEQFKELINIFSSNIVPQVTIYNRTMDKEAFIDLLKLRSRKDDLNELRQEYNSIIAEKVTLGNNCTTKEKYLTVSAKASDIVVATQLLDNIDLEITSRLQQLCHRKIEQVTTKDRLKMLYEIYNLDSRDRFDDFSFIDKENDDIDYDLLEESGLSCKDIVGPKYFERHNGYMQFGKKFAKSLYLYDVSNNLTPDILSKISSLPANMITSVIYENIDPDEAAKKIHRKSMSVRDQIYNNQSKASKKGVNADLISPSLQEEDDNLTITRDLTTNEDERMVVITLCVTVFGDSKEEINKFANIVSDSAKAKFCTLTEMIGSQLACFNTSIPVCLNAVSTGRQMLTSAAAGFIPLEAQDLKHDKGIYFAINHDTKNIIALNQAKVRPNSNMVVTGTSGSGKSFLVKKLIYCMALSNSTDDLYIIDPESEYKNITRALGGQILDIMPAEEGGAHINVMDMDLEYGDSEEGIGNPVGLKSDYMAGFLEALNTGEYDLSSDPQITNLLDRYMKELYAPYLSDLKERRKEDPNLTIDYKTMPTLLDLYNLCLRESADERARYIANLLEKCAVGTYANFAEHTDIDRKKNLMMYNTNQLGKAMKRCGSYIALNDAWNRAIRNHYRGIHTYIYIDEIHVFMKNKATASLIEDFVKRARKWDVSIIGITQDIEDLTSTKEGRNFFNNCGIKVSMAQDKAGRDEIEDILRLSKSQLSHITTAVPGSGIIACEGSIISFDDYISKNTRFYSVVNTSGDQEDNLYG